MAKRALGDDPLGPEVEASKPAGAAPRRVKKAAPRKDGKTDKTAAPAKVAAPKGDAKAKKAKKAKKVKPPAEAVAEPVIEAVVEAVVEPVAEPVVEPVVDAVVDAVVVEEEPRVPVSTAPGPAPVPLAASSSESMEGRAEYGPSIDVPRRREEGEVAGGGLGQRIGLTLRTLEALARKRLGAEPDYQGRQKPPLEFLWRRWRQVAMRDRSDAVDEFGRDPTVVDELAPFLEFFYTSWFRVQTQGIENIPAEGRALLVGNHGGTLPWDGAMILHGVRRDHPSHREVRPLVEDFVFHFPWLGTLMNRIGAVRACQENAERLLRGGQLVAVFPEGIKGIGKLYAQRYQLQRFGRGGFIKLALATDSPIVPVAVVGAEETHPMLTRVTWLSKATRLPFIPVTPTFPWLGPLGLLPFPTRWTIRFGEPLDFAAQYGPEAASDRLLVGKLAEQVRQRIQDMVDALLRERQSIFFG